MRRYILVALVATLLAGSTLVAVTSTHPTPNGPVARIALALAGAPGTAGVAGRTAYTTASFQGSASLGQRRTESRSVGDFIKKIRRFLRAVRGIIDQILAHTTDGPNSGGGGGIVKGGNDGTGGL